MTRGGPWPALPRKCNEITRTLSIGYFATLLCRRICQSASGRITNMYLNPLRLMLRSCQNLFYSLWCMHPTWSIKYHVYAIYWDNCRRISDEYLSSLVQCESGEASRIIIPCKKLYLGQAFSWVWILDSGLSFDLTLRSSLGRYESDLAKRGLGVSKVPRLLFMDRPIGSWRAPMSNPNPKWPRLCGILFLSCFWVRQEDPTCA